MLYGFIDESGLPGKSLQKEDYLCATLLLFPNLETVEEAISEIENLRKVLSLLKDFEFHFAENTEKIQKEFMRLISNFNFQYIFSYVLKTNFSSVGSYKNLTADMLRQLASFTRNTLVVRMDDNPALYSELRKQAKDFNLKLRIKQVHSKNAPLVQVADYIVSASSRVLRNKAVPSVWKRIDRHKRIK